MPRDTIPASFAPLREPAPSRDPLTLESLITSVAECSPEAQKAWETAPWRS